MSLLQSADFAEEEKDAFKNAQPFTPPDQVIKRNEYLRIIDTIETFMTDLGREMEPLVDLHDKLQLTSLLEMISKESAVVNGLSLYAACAGFAKTSCALNTLPQIATRLCILTLTSSAYGTTPKSNQRTKSMSLARSTPSDNRTISTTTNSPYLAAACTGIIRPYATYPLPMPPDPSQLYLGSNFCSQYTTRGSTYDRQVSWPRAEAALSREIGYSSPIPIAPSPHPAIYQLPQAHSGTKNNTSLYKSLQRSIIDSR